MLQEQKSSGLSVTAWCEENDVSRNTYFYWQKRLREHVCEELALRTETSMVQVPPFAEIKLRTEESSGAIVVRMNGAEIEIKDGTSPELVESVLKVLRQSC